MWIRDRRQEKLEASSLPSSLRPRHLSEANSVGGGVRIIGEFDVERDGLIGGDGVDFQQGAFHFQSMMFSIEELDDRFHMFQGGATLAQRAA